MTSPVRQLLFTDFEGGTVDDPDLVIDAGLHEPAQAERVPGLVQALYDPATDSLDQFLAAYALTTWAEPAGFAAVQDAVRAGRDAPWYGDSIDRLYSVDDTFNQLAGGVSRAYALATGKGTEPQRLETLRALIGIADVEYFEDGLIRALSPRLVPEFAADIKAVVIRGVRRLADGYRPGFDLGGQLADLAGLVAGVQDPLGVQLGSAILSVDSSPGTCRRLTDVVGRGTGTMSLQFGEQLALVGGEEAASEVARAIERRRRREAKATAAG